MYQVIKRDGKISEFDIQKIAAAITKAFDALQKQYRPERHRYAGAAGDGKLRAQDQGGQDRRRGHTRQRGGGARAGGLRRRRQVLHPLPQAARKDPQHEEHHARLQEAGGQLREGDRLACKGELDGDLLRRRAHPLQQRRDHGELLAVRDLRRGDRQRPPQRGDPHPRPLHADRLLRGLVAQTAHPGGGWAASRARSPRRRRSTWRRCATRWSTSSASCRTSGRARRRFLPSTPTSRPSSRRTTSTTTR